MCRSREHGGQRCAAHTRAALRCAERAASRDDSIANVDALQAARAEHAATPAGRAEIAAEMATAAPAEGAALAAALAAGGTIAERNRALASLPAAGSSPASDPSSAPMTGLRPGQEFLYGTVRTRVLRAVEPWKDRFERPMYQVWCRRADTGAEGYVRFGPDGQVQVLPETPQASPAPEVSQTGTSRTPGAGPRTAVDPMDFQIANNGSGKNRWFLARADSVSIAERYHEGASGQLVRYSSPEAAHRAAVRLNNTRRAALDTQPAPGI